MQVQTTSSLAEMQSNGADKFKPLLNDPKHQVILSAEVGRVLGVPAITQVHHIQGKHVVTASYSDLTNLSDAERKSLEKAFGQIKRGVLDDIKKAPQGNGNMLGAKVLLGAIEHIAPWADPHKQSAALLSVEAAQLLTDAVKVLEPYFPALKKVEAICKFIGVAAHVGEKVIVYRLEHPTP